MLGSHASGHRAAYGSTAPDDQAPSFAECAAEAARDLPRAEQLTTVLFDLSRAAPYFDTGDLAPGTSSRSAPWSSGWSPARPSSTAASARSVREQLRQHYREGQDPVGALGLVVNAIVLWNTRYAHAALNHPCGSGYHVRNDDMQRPSSTTTSTCADATSSALPTCPWPASTAARHHHSRRDRHPDRYRRILLHCC